jgi:hypothetical protein
MKLFVIEIPKLINGEILLLNSLLRPSALTTFRQAYELGFSSESSACYTIETDGPDMIFQGVTFDNLRHSPKISYFPLFPDELFIKEILSEGKSKDIVVFYQSSHEISNFISRTIVTSFAESTGKKPETVELDFFRDLIDKANEATSDAPPPSRRHMKIV